MNRSHGTLWTLQRAERHADRYPQALLLGVLVLLIVFGALSIRGASPSGVGASSPTSHAVLARATPMATTQYGGALTVTSGQNVTIGPSTGHLTYYEGGNVTVASGGTLNIHNTTLVFVEFVGGGGSVASQLTHVYSLTDAGTIILVNSSITTFVSQLNPFPILTVTITGVFQMTSGALEFPGSITVEGSTANFWVSHSLIERNPAVADLASNGSGNISTPAAVAFTNAVNYGPSIQVLEGAQATWLASAVNNTFADPLNGTTLPGIAPSRTLTGAVVNTVPPAALVLPPPSNATDALALEAVYPTVTSGTLTVAYSAAATGTTSNSNFDIGASSWTFAPITFPTSGGSTVRAPIPAAAIASINSGGVDSYLAALSAGQVSVAFGTSTAPVTVTNVSVTFVAPWTFNITVSGAGSTLTAADTLIDANWNATPGLPGKIPYIPWDSNKLLLNAGAQAFLGNVSIPSPAPLDFAHQSFVVPDSTSSATFYRWLEVPVRGAGGIIVQGATVQAQYAYSGASSENATVTSLNDLATADPALAQYVTAWDESVGVSTYGEVDAQGNASLLLASEGVLNSSLPDGNFLGDYHVGVTANPGSSPLNQWFYASLPAYPYEMQPTGPNATGPLVTSTVVFPQYRVVVSPSSPTITTAGALVTNNSTAIGQQITIKELVRNIGTGTAATMSVRLELSAVGKAPTQVGAVQNFGSLGPGASRLVEFNWTVNATLVGYAPEGVLSNLTVIVSWDPGAGSAIASTTITIYPPYISFSTSGPSGTLLVGNSYVMHAFVGYAGNGTALINASARSTSGGFYEITFGRVISQGETNISVVLESSITPGTYSITASVYHDGRTVYHNVTNAFVIPTTVSPTPTPWYDQSFLGLALWLWLVIVAAAVAAILAFLFISVQKAKGKVVECGECGAMIPETAVACPECGAEFESDRVRCSRCGSTIPGNSAICPECAATLLGRAGEEKDDPERQGYADFVERFRAEGKKALGDSYSESAFWDWWKRQSTYVPFGQWKMQQAQGSRTGMGAPRENVPKDEATTTRPPPPRRGPPPGGPRSPPPSSPPATSAAPAPTTPPGPAPSEIPPAAAAGMITCSNCQKEIPSGYLVCPFCGAVTQ